MESLGNRVHGHESLGFMKSGKTETELLDSIALPRVLKTVFVIKKTI
jgi:hypothetical protein